MTKRNAIPIIKAWLKRDKMRDPFTLRHIHPHTYVVGYAAPGCLVVAACWQESEPHLREFQKANPLGIVRRFDASLRPGDWCITVYVATRSGGESVAVPYDPMKAIGDGRRLRAEAGRGARGTGGER